MTIQAKDIKVGMTVKYGNVWIKVETIEETTFKNGKAKIDLIGTKQAGTIRRSNGVRQKQYEEPNYDCYFKAETKVQVK